MIHSIHTQRGPATSCEGSHTFIHVKITTSSLVSSIVVGTRVGDHDVGDGGAGVVDGQCDWDGLVGKRSDGQTREGANDVRS